MWDDDEAQRWLRVFLDRLADGRALHADHADSVEHAEANGLLLLIGPAEEEVLDQVLARTPPVLAQRWRTALSGRPDGFLSGEGVTERDGVQAEIRAGRRRLLSWLAATVVVLGLAAGALVVLWPDEEPPPTGRIFFNTSGPDAQQDDPNRFAGDTPVVNRNLLARLDRPVAVRSGGGDATGRATAEVDPSVLPAPPGAVSATLFRHAGQGHVVLVGPPGFASRACVQVSAVAPTLRPFDTSVVGAAGACPPGVVGRAADVGCRGDTALMVGLVLPPGEVALEEGGAAGVGAVRVAVFGVAAGYEQVSLRGTITVPVGTSEAVPAFGGRPGEQVAFDVTPADAATPVIGRCTLT